MKPFDYEISAANKGRGDFDLNYWIQSSLNPSQNDSNIMLILEFVYILKNKRN